MSAANQARCNGNGWAYSPSADVCIYTGGRDGSTQYFDPVTLLQLSSPPIAAPTDLIWPGAVDPVRPPKLPPQEMPAPAPIPQVQQVPGITTGTGTLDGILGFLSAPSLFGLPTWVVILGAIAGVYAVSQMDTGGRKKKGGGLF